jgi:hypothetical protein
MNDKLRTESIWQNIRPTLFQKFSSGFCRKVLAYRKVILFGLLFAGTIGIFAAPAWAQTPAWSRGIQNLSISFDECKSRARRALDAEGYTIENQGGSFNSDFFFAGYKDVHNAVITCNSSPEGKTWANIFVASCTGNRNANVPGAERVRLQQRMDQSSSAGCGLGRVWNDIESGLNMTWVRRGDSNVFDVSGIAGGNTFTAEQAIEIRGNKVYINRYKASDGNTCTFEGTIQSDGVTVIGTYECTKYKPSSGWRATINCGGNR